MLGFCRSMRRVERLEVVTPEFIRSRAIPERSDFRYSMAEWTFAAEGGGTRVTYEMEMEPNFWLPPFVGPWFLKRTLLRGAPAAIDQIELLAQEEQRARHERRPLTAQTARNAVATGRRAARTAGNKPPTSPTLTASSIPTPSSAGVTRISNTSGRRCRRA